MRKTLILKILFFKYRRLFIKKLKYSLIFLFILSLFYIFLTPISAFHLIMPLAEAYLQLCQASKMKCFAKLVNP